MNLVADTHRMLRLAKDCLKDTDTERPSAQQICLCLSALKKAPWYVQSLEGRGGEREGGKRVVEGRREGRDREGESQERKELIRQLKEENEILRGVVGKREREIETFRGVVQKKERELREREREVRVKSEQNQCLRRLLHDNDCTIHQLQ